MTVSVYSVAYVCTGSIGLPALLSRAGADKERKAECLDRGNLAKHNRYTTLDGSNYMEMPRLGTPFYRTARNDESLEANSHTETVPCLSRTSIECIEIGRAHV